MRIQPFPLIGWIDLDHVLRVSDVREQGEEESPVILHSFAIDMMMLNKPIVVTAYEGGVIRDLNAQLVTAWRGEAAAG